MKDNIIHDRNEYVPAGHDSPAKFAERLAARRRAIEHAQAQVDAVSRYATRRNGKTQKTQGEHQ